MYIKNMQRTNRKSISLSPTRTIREDAYMRPYSPIPYNYAKATKPAKNIQTVSPVKPVHKKLKLYKQTPDLINIYLLVLFVFVMLVICKIIIIEIFG